MRVACKSILLVALLGASNFANAQKDNYRALLPARTVTGNVLTSTEFPTLKLNVDGAFRYIGTFRFDVAGIAVGERFIFAETRGRTIKKLFILQFETILPESNETYNYSFADALTIGSLKFRPNTFAFATSQSPKKDPPDEGELTTRFLESKGYTVPAEIMSARLVNVPGAERKHEMILFYMESVSDSGHSLKDFYEGEERTPLWRELSDGLSQRLLKSFTIIE